MTAGALGVWICHVPACPLKGRPQRARDPGRAFDAHYLDEHYQPATPPASHR